MLKMPASFFTSLGDAEIQFVCQQLNGAVRF